MSLDLNEILSAHADQLNRDEQPSADAYLDAAPEQRAEIVSLMKTATRAKRALASVTIAPAFRTRLRDGLTMAAHHKESQSVLFGGHDSTWGWVIGAAALGSAAGLIAMAWRARHLQRAVADVASPSGDAGVGVKS